MIQNGLTLRKRLRDPGNSQLVTIADWSKNFPSRATLSSNQLVNSGLSAGSYLFQNFIGNHDNNIQLHLPSSENVYTWQQGFPGVR